STAVPGRVPAGIDRYHALASPRHVRRHRAAVLLAVKNKPLRARDPRAFLTATRHVGVYSVRPGRKDGSAGPNKRIDQGARSLFLPSLVTHSCQRGGLFDAIAIGWRSTKPLTPAAGVRGPQDLMRKSRARQRNNVLRGRK